MNCANLQIRTDVYGNTGQGQETKRLLCAINVSRNVCKKKNPLRKRGHWPIATRSRAKKNCYKSGSNFPHNAQFLQQKCTSSILHLLLSLLGHWVPPWPGESAEKLEKTNAVRHRHFRQLYFVYKFFVSHLFYKVCGKEIKAEPRIIGGAPVSKNEFPWLVGLGSYWRDEPNCGASLISDRCKCLKINKIQFRQFLVFKKVGSHCGPLHPDWSPPEVPTRELP